jgi:hypothetical protein
VADGDFRDEVKCACPRIGGRECYEARNPPPFDDLFRADHDSFDDDECACRCHDLRAEWELDRLDDDEFDDEAGYG